MAHQIPDLQEIKNAVKAALLEIEHEKERKRQSQKLYSVNQVAKKLGKAHQTISKLIKAGYIKTTASGLISEDAINEYLRNY